MLWLYALVAEAPDGVVCGAAWESVTAWPTPSSGGEESGRRLFALAGEMEAPLPLGEDTLRAHDRAVRELAARCDPLLPVRFGQCVAAAEELATLLAPRREALLAALDRVAGCEQHTLRFRRLEPTLPAAGSIDAAASAPPAEPATRGPGARYLLARRRATVVEPPPEAAAVLAHLAPHRREERLAAAPAPFLLAAHHLVERSRRDAWLAALAQTAAAAPAGLVTRSGPFPPWAFAPRELA